MQEDVDNKTIALAVKATKITGKLIKEAVVKFLQLCKKGMANRAQNKSGEVSLDDLRSRNGELNSVVIQDSDTKRLDKVCRKYHVRYSVFKKDNDQFIILFKSPDAESMRYAMEEFAENKPTLTAEKSVREKLKNLKRRAEREKTKIRTRKREKQPER